MSAEIRDASTANSHTPACHMMCVGTVTILTSCLMHFIEQGSTVTLSPMHGEKQAIPFIQPLQGTQALWMGHHRKQPHSTQTINQHIGAAVQASLYLVSSRMILHTRYRSGKTHIHNLHQWSHNPSIDKAGTSARHAGHAGHWSAQTNSHSS